MSAFHLPVRKIFFASAMILWFATGEAAGQQSAAVQHDIKHLLRLSEASITTSLDSTYLYASRAWDISLRVDDPEGMIQALDLLARYYNGKNNLQAALEKFFQKLDIYRTHPGLPGHTNTLTRISILFAGIGAVDKSEYYYSRARDVHHDYYNPTDAAFLYDVLGQIEMTKHRYREARQAIYMAIGYYTRLGLKEPVARCYRTLGDIHIQLSEPGNAIYCYQQSLNYYREEGNLTEMGILHTRIGHVYQEIHDNVRLLSHNLEALRIREQSGRVDFYGASLINVGVIYMEQGRMDSAGFYLKKGYQVLKDAGNMVFLENACRQLYHYYRHQGDFRQSLFFYRDYLEMRERILLSRSEAALSASISKRALLESEMSWQLLEQQKKIQELQIRNRKVRILFYEILFLVVTGLGILIMQQSGKIRQSRRSLVHLNRQLEEEIIKQVETEKKLADSESLYRFIAENTTDVISLLDARLNRIYISPSCKSLYGYSEEEIYAMEGIVDLIAPVHRERILESFTRMTQEMRPAKFTYQALRKDGSVFWAESLVNPLFHPETGAFREMVTVVRDITRRVEYEEMIARNASQRELLLREIHHRVKNNFAILISLMELQKNREKRPQSSPEISDLQLRVRAMSLVHEQLYRSDSIHLIRFDEYLRNLAIIISSAFSNKNINLHTLIEPGNLHIRLALPLGLIMNELLTNVYKYAFPENRKGNVWITLEKQEKLSKLSVVDDGIGLPAGFNLDNPTSMGSRIVAILIEQIEARLEINRENGAGFHIYFSDYYD